jgi:hypothetical protein
MAAYLSNIKFVVTIIDISHIRVAVIGADNNRLANKCKTTNKGIRSTTTDSEHNRELAFDSIRTIVYA